MPAFASAPSSMHLTTGAHSPPISAAPAIPPPLPHAINPHTPSLRPSLHPSSPQLVAGDLHMQPHESNMRAPCADVMSAAASHQPAFTMEQEYTVLDPFTGLPPGVFSGALPIYVPGANNRGNDRLSRQHSCCDSGSAFGSPCGLGGHLAGSNPGSFLACSFSPGSGASCGDLAASLSAAAALPGGAAAAARLLLQAQAQPTPPPHGSPAARRARQLSELHMRACIKAGLRYAGAAPAGCVSGGRCCDAWSYRIGPCMGVDMGDQLCVSRFLLRRISENLSVDVSFSPCHAKRDGISGSSSSADGGCSTEFSTLSSRCPLDGTCELQRLITRLQQCHSEHAAGYGAPCAAAPPFSVAVGDRRASIVIPTSSLLARCGPFVDRRPSGSCDPYLVTALITAGALGLPLPPGAALALAARKCGLSGRTRLSAPSGAGAAVPVRPLVAPAAVAAQLLLQQQQLRAAVALSAAAAAAAARCGAAAAPQPSCSAGASFGSHDHNADDADVFDDDGSDSDGEDSRDMLISEIRRIDREARRHHHAAHPDHDGAAAAAPVKGGQQLLGSFHHDANCAGFEGFEDGDDFDDFEDDDEDDDYEGEEDDSASSSLASPAGSGSGERGDALAASCREGRAADACDMILV